MKPFVHTLAVLAVASVVCAETVHFTDGTHIEVASYEIREHVVILLTADGKLRSVPKSLVRVEELADEEAMLAEAIELVGLRRLTDGIAASAQDARRRRRCGNAMHGVRWRPLHLRPPADSANHDPAWVRRATTS